MLHQRAYLLSHPDDIQAILQENADAFAKGRSFKKLKLLLGDGLITSEGELWKKQNRLMRPVFGLKHMLELVPAIQDIIRQHCQWSHGQEIDVHAEMNALTLKIIARTLFDFDISREAPQFLRDVEFMLRFLLKRVRSIAAAPMWLPLAGHREFFAARDRFDGLVQRLIDERRASPSSSKDLLQILLDTRDEQGQAMSDRQIRDEVITTLMAGHETITNTMAWTMILLGQNSQYQAPLQQEAATFWDAGVLNAQAFNRVNLHAAVADEAMRLWPPVWAFMRQAARTIELPELTLKKKDIVFLVPFFTQRSSDFWAEPLRFRPERFLPPEREGLVNGAFFPFGLGPRMCIGKVFAQVEAKLILSHLVSHYHWKSEAPAEQTVEAGITLKPTNNTKLKMWRHGA